MRMTAWLVATLLAASPAGARTPVEIRTDDVTTFFRLFDAAHGAPTAATLQRDYIDAGSDGVRQFVPDRIVSGEALAAEVARERPVYDQARACLRALPAVKHRLRAAFARLARIDPEARFPPVTILIGRNNSGGTTGPSGVLIGLEVACRSSWLQADPADRLVHLIAHEYGHVEQPPGIEAHATVLSQSLVEGGAELVGALISGEVSNVHLQRWAAPRAAEIDARFVADLDKTHLSAWLYNGVGTPEQPGDLGYWIGYRIARAYYDRAADKRTALRTLLAVRDPHAILAASGWYPASPS